MILSPLRVMTFAAGLCLSPAAQDRIEYRDELYPGGASDEQWLLSRVVDTLTGEPVAGAEVFLVRERETPLCGEFWFSRKVRTDAGGWLRVPVEGVGWHMQVLKHPDYGTCSRGSDRSAIWRVNRAFDLPVLVTDALGRPAPGANIGFCGGCGHTPDLVNAVADDNGVAVLRGVDPWNHIRDIYVQHPGLTIAYDSVRWFPGDGPKELRCGWAEPITGTLLDADGKPVAGAYINGGGVHRGPWGRTDANGRFTILGEDGSAHRAVLPDGRKAYFPDYHGHPVTLRLPADNGQEHIEGTAQGARAAPPPEPEVRVIGVRVVDGPKDVEVWAAYPGSDYRDRLEEGGRVKLPASGPCLLAVEGKVDGVDETREFAFDDAASIADPVELRWVPDVRLRGRAVDEDGRPVPVRARFRDNWQGAAEDDRTKFVDGDDGSFSLRCRDQGRELLELVADRADLLPRLMWVTVPGRARQQVDLGDVVLRKEPQLIVTDDQGRVRTDGDVGLMRPGFDDVDSAFEFPVRADGAWVGVDLQPGDAIYVRFERGMVPYREVLTGAGPWHVRVPTGELRLDVRDDLGNEVEAIAVIGDYDCRLRPGVALRGLRRGPVRCFVSAIGCRTAVVDTVIGGETKVVEVVLPRR